MILSEIAEFKNGKYIPKDNIDPAGKYPIYGSNGIIGRTNNFLYNGNLIIIGRVGACGEINISEGKSWITDNTIILRPKKDVDFDYLVRFLKYAGLKIHKSGTSQPLITQTQVKRINIPFPSLSIQHKIASILEKAEFAREKRKEANHLTDELLQSAFMEMFGDPIKNPKGWQKVKVSVLGKVQTGNTPSRKNPKYYGGYIEWIKSDNIINGEMFVTKSREMLSEEGLKKARLVGSGSILVTCIAGSPTSIGNIALTNRKVAFNQQINAVTPYKDVDSFFLYGLFRIAKQLVQKSTTLGMKRIITKSKFENLELIKPPLPKQQKFADIVLKVEKLKEKQRESEKELNNLFNSLMQKAFRGELVN